MGRLRIFIGRVIDYIISSHTHKEWYYRHIESKPPQPYENRK